MSTSKHVVLNFFFQHLFIWKKNSIFAINNTLLWKIKKELF